MGHPKQKLIQDRSQTEATRQTSHGALWFLLPSQIGRPRPFSIAFLVQEIAEELRLISCETQVTPVADFR
jgi:hypothetical protein